MTNKVIIFLFPTKLDNKTIYNYNGDYMIIDNLLLLGICLFFPISIYLNYSTYVKTFELTENTIILEFIIIISLLLILKYDMYKNIYSIPIYLLPIFIAIIKKNIRLIIILIIILFFFTNLTIEKINLFYLSQTTLITIIYSYLIVSIFKLGSKLIDLSNRLLNAMHKTGFEQVMIYQDETSSGNLHINFIPKHEWTYQFRANFSEMGLYAKNTLNISDEYRKELLDIIEKIKINFK